MKIGTVLLCALLVSGCSALNWGKPKGVDYKKASALPSLEIPPDLTVPEGAAGLAMPTVYATTLSQMEARTPAGIVAGGSSVLPAQENVAVQRDGQMRWLNITAPADQVWDRVREFWLQSGFELRIERSRIGIMETQWAENRADIPQDFIRSTISRLFPNAYSAPTRDKFRVRLEHGEADGTTLLYLTHYGVTEVIKGETQSVWEHRPSDPELVNEMLSRLLVFLGVQQEAADRAIAEAEDAGRPRARMETAAGGAPVLVVDEGFARAWRRAGIALDRVGLVIEDRDRSRGIYYVRYVDPLEEVERKGEKGFFSRLFSKGDDGSGSQERYRVVLRHDAELTRVYLEPEENVAAEPARVEDLLTRLLSELR